MMTPKPPATVTMEVLNTPSYPREIKNGIVMAPTADTVAGELPEIAP